MVDNNPKDVNSSVGPSGSGALGRFLGFLRSGFGAGLNKGIESIIASTPVNNGALAILKYFEETIMFDPKAPQSMIRAPEEYGLTGFKPVFLEIPKASKPGELGEINPAAANGDNHTKLGLWVKEPADPTQPVYVVFHGRFGHWAEAGRQESHGNPNYDKEFRLKWLKELAKTGAGVIAVHTRGHGLSRTDENPMSETLFERDIEKIADYVLKEKRFNPDRVIVAGESLGSALATMLAEKMNAMGKPPAGLALINGFARMADSSAMYIRNTPLINLIPKDIAPALLKRMGIDPDTVKHLKLDIPVDDLDKKLRNKFPTAERIRKLNPEMDIYIANNLKDDVIPSDQHRKLCAAARQRGVNHNEGQDTLTPVQLKNEYIKFSPEPHINWDPAAIVVDLQDLYDRRCQAYASGTGTRRNYVSLVDKNEAPGISYP